MSEAASWLFDAKEGWLLGKKPEKGRRVIAKLNNEAASIGLTKSCVMDIDEQCISALENMSTNYRQPLFIQEFVAGYEVECSVIKHPVTRELAFAQPIGVTMGGDPFLGEVILDYSLRNITKEYQWMDFRQFNPKLSATLPGMAMNIVSVLGIDSIARVDFRIDSGFKPYVTDIATNPHLTPGSSFAFAAKLHGVSYPDMLAAILGHALLRRKQSS